MNLDAFPFYSTLEQQVRFGEVCGKQASRIDLVCRNDRFLPFRIKRDAIGQPLSCVNIYDAETDTLFLVLPATDLNYEIVSADGTEWILYYGNQIPSFLLDCGRYYLEIAGFYSEVFLALNSVEGLVKMEWYNSTDIGDYIYQTGFRNIMYLPKSIIIQPEYEFETDAGEGITGSRGSLVAVEKRYRLDTLPIHESLIDAVQGLFIHDHINIGNFFDVKRIRLELSWIEGTAGCLGNVEISFSDSHFAVTSACDNSSRILSTVDLSGPIKPWLCGGSSTEPYWEATGALRCKGTAYPGFAEKEEKDVNPGTNLGFRWVDSGYNYELCPLPEEETYIEGIDPYCK